MTREEAIENLQRLQNLLSNDPYIDTQTIITTCNVAIEALKQEPCKDAISRQAAIEKIKRYSDMLWDKFREPFPQSTILELIQDLPSVKPQEPKTGHWIIHGEPPINVIECSECGQKYHNHYCQPLAHFCSMCGYRMVEPQESEGSDADSD